MSDVSRWPRVYLDTNVFIDAYEGEERLSQPARTLIEELQAKTGAAVTSELTLAEVLAKPEAEKNVLRKRAYLDLIVWNRFVTLVPVTRDVLLETAKIRAAHEPKLKLADAIHLVTAIQENCAFFITRDIAITTPASMQRLEPGADAARLIREALA